MRSKLNWKYICDQKWIGDSKIFSHIKTQIDSKNIEDVENFERRVNCPNRDRDSQNYFNKILDAVWAVVSKKRFKLTKSN